MVTSVLSAHKDYVVSQKKNATFILRGSENIPIFSKTNKELPTDIRPEVLFSKNDLNISIYHKDQEEYLGIVQSGFLVYFENISREICNLLRALDWLEP